MEMIFLNKKLSEPIKYFIKLQYIFNLLVGYQIYGFIGIVISIGVSFVIDFSIPRWYVNFNAKSIKNVISSSLESVSRQLLI